MKPIIKGGRPPLKKALALLGAAMLAWFFFSAYLSPEVRYGFDQLKILPAAVSAGLAAAALLLVLLVRLRDRTVTEGGDPLPYGKLLLPALAASVSAAALFWFLRNGFINDDGLVNMISLQGGLRIIHHDEMLSSLLVTKLWQSGIAGFRPEDSISLFSAAWGGVFVFVTVLLGGRLTGSRWPLFTLLCLSSGFVQMFAGDVEFYSMVAALVSLYLLACLEYQRGNLSSILPGIVLSLAICSHLLAGWLLPSYLYLLFREIRRRKTLEVIASIAAMVLVAGFLFMIVSSAGLPVHQVASSHAMGSADRSTLDMLAVPSLHYHAGVVNVLFLVFPYWPVLLLMLIYRRLSWTPFNAVVVISTAMLLLLSLVWRLGLGPYFDWNLVASVGVPASVLVWGNMLRGEWKPGMKTSVCFVLLVGALHSWTWISGNHFQFSMLSREQTEEMYFPTGRPFRMFFPPESP